MTEPGGQTEAASTPSPGWRQKGASYLLLLLLLRRRSFFVPMKSRSSPERRRAKGSAKRPGGGLLAALGEKAELRRSRFSEGALSAQLWGRKEEAGEPNSAALVGKENRVESPGRGGVRRCALQEPGLAILWRESWREKAAQSLVFFWCVCVFGRGNAESSTWLDVSPSFFNK